MSVREFNSLFLMMIYRDVIEFKCAAARRVAKIFAAPCVSSCLPREPGKILLKDHCLSLLHRELRVATGARGLWLSFRRETKVRTQIGLLSSLPCTKTFALPYALRAKKLAFCEWSRLASARESAILAMTSIHTDMTPEAIKVYATVTGVCASNPR